MNDVYDLSHFPGREPTTVCGGSPSGPGSAAGCRPLLAIVCGVVWLLLLVVAPAAVPQDFAVDLRVSPSDSVPHLTLNWSLRLRDDITSQRIHRRVKGASTWILLDTLSTGDVSYADHTAESGVEYEYWLERQLSVVPSDAFGYISAGVKVPATRDRGVILLVVDATMEEPLAPEIAQLELDLAGDGWRVYPITAPRSGSVADTKEAIFNAHYENPGEGGVGMVYLLGHVPVPYSGSISPDGHGNHRGAWAADTFYGDVDGDWTDAAVNNTSASREENRNVPGDGKYDNSTLPSALELGVGRVDLASLSHVPSGHDTEVSRLRNYLQRAHDYRHKQGAYAAIPRRTLIRDHFGHFTRAEPFAAVGWAAAYTSVGPSPDIDIAGKGEWFTERYASGRDYLWGVATGGGQYTTMSGFGRSADFGHHASRVVFLTMFGSYFGDWDSSNNLMRTAIAGNAAGDSLGLVCFWSGRPHWFLHPLGMGETFGSVMRTSANAGLVGGYRPGGLSFGGVHPGLMGDPALRLHMVEPVRRLGVSSADGEVFLDWDAPAESGVEGYEVSRFSDDPMDLELLTEEPIAATNFTDTDVVAGEEWTYFVRTLKLEEVPGGSYYNLSVGTPVTINVSDGAGAAPASPTSLAIAGGAGPAGVVLVWEDNSDDETGFRIERLADADGRWSEIGTTAPDVRSYTDGGPFSHGSTYYYRVVAENGHGDSAASGIDSFMATAGFVEMAGPLFLKADKSSGSVAIAVRRFGGGAGRVSVTCATSDTSAVAGIHYSGRSTRLTWEDGEQGEKLFSVPLTPTAGAQLAREFNVSVSSPSGGLRVGLRERVAVLIEDGSAALPAPWVQTVVGTGLHDSSPFVQDADGVFGSSAIGGGFLNSGTTGVSGNFMYQTRRGNGTMVAYVDAPVPREPQARVALMVQASTDRDAVMAGVVTSERGGYGTKLVARSGTGGRLVIEPGYDNDLDAPRWLRISRSGAVFTGSTSTDGSTWTTVGLWEVPAMPADALWGVFHYGQPATSADNYQLATVRDIEFFEIGLPETPSIRQVDRSPQSTWVVWTPPAFAEGIVVEKLVEGGTWTVVEDEEPGQVDRLKDTDISPDTAYGYRVKAYNSLGESPWSEPHWIVTPHERSITEITADDGDGADAVLRAGVGDGNFGGGAALVVADLDQDVGDVSVVTKVLLRFDLGNLPRFFRATLKLAYLGGENHSISSKMDTYVLDGAGASSWEEGGVTWNSAPQNDTGGTGLTTGSHGRTGSLRAASLPEVGGQAAIGVPTWANGVDLRQLLESNTLLSLALVPGGGTNHSVMRWASREHSTLPPPTLEVETDPLMARRPGFLEAVPDGSGMRLEWIEDEFAETGFEVERREVGGEWQRLATLPPGSVRHDDRSAAAGVLYEYRVRTAGLYLPSNWMAVGPVSRVERATIVGAVTSVDATRFERWPNTRQLSHGPLSYRLSGGGVLRDGDGMVRLRNDLSGWVGMEIRTGPDDLEIGELGRWVAPENGESHVLILVDVATGATIGATTVDNEGAVEGEFLYAALDRPVTLQAGRAYYVLSEERAGGDAWYDFDAGFDGWLSERGLSGEADGVGGDGVPHLIKYALGLEPGDAGSGRRLGYGVVSDGGADYGAFIYTVPEPAVPDVVYSVEACGDLGAGEWSGEGLVEVGSVVEGSLRTVTVRDRVAAGAGGKRFMRLKVTWR